MTSYNTSLEHTSKDNDYLCTQCGKGSMSMTELNALIALTQLQIKLTLLYIWQSYTRLHVLSVKKVSRVRVSS